MPNPRIKFLPPKISGAVDGIKQLDSRGLLYYMDYSGNYYLLQKLVDRMTNPGCSTFLTDKLGGGKLFCRNYDFSHYRYNKKGGPEDITGLIIVMRCANPKAKYKSIGIADGFWLDSEKGRFFEGSLSDGKTDVTKLAAIPFAVMDGANEAGLAVSIMHLPTENNWIEREYISPEEMTEDERKTAVILEVSGAVPERLDSKIKKNYLAVNTWDKKCWYADKNLAVNQQEAGKKTVIHPVLMRRMLDFAGNVDEAVEIARSFNVKSAMPDNDYHILVSDRSGKSVILEWIYNTLTITETIHGTNFYKARSDHYGYGYERDAVLEACLNKYKNGMSEEIAMRTLQLASQNSPEGSDVGFTQWSSIYDLDRNTLKLSVFMDYEQYYDFKI